MLSSKEKRYNYKKSRIIITLALSICFFPFVLGIISLCFNTINDSSKILLWGISEILLILPCIFSLVSFIKTLENFKNHNLYISKKMMILNLVSIFFDTIAFYIIFAFTKPNTHLLYYLILANCLIHFICFFLYRNYWLFGSIYHESAILNARLHNLSNSLMNTANYMDSYISNSSYTFRKLQNIHEASIIDSLTRTNGSVRNRVISLLVPLIIYAILIGALYCLDTFLI